MFLFSSLEQQAGVLLTSSIDVTHLQEPEAMDLISHLDQFDAVVMQAYEQMEPSVLAKYLFKLG